MNFLKNNRSILLAIFISFALISCSEDDDKNSGPTSGSINPTSALGVANLSISSDMEGQRMGIADFDHKDHGAMQTWEISMQDYSPQTFDLKIMRMSEIGDLSNPEPGTYEIGNVIRDAGVYWADLKIIENQGFGHEVMYSTLFAEAGTLTIITSTEETISGTLEFTAHQYDEDAREVISAITVSGNFSAKPKIFYYQ